MKLLFLGLQFGVVGGFLFGVLFVDLPLFGLICLCFCL